MKRLSLLTVLGVLFLAAACDETAAESPDTDAGLNVDAGPQADGGNGDDPDGHADTIAPNCQSTSCYEVRVRSSLSCETFGGGDNDYSFVSTLAIEGKTENGGCTTYKDDATGRVDVHCQVLTPEGTPQSDSSQVYFRLKDYKGPGTYELIDEEDLGGGSRGLVLVGNVDSPRHPDKFGRAFTTPCGRGCIATVSDRSEPAGGLHEVFRFEVDITCPNAPLVDAIPPACSWGTRCMPSEDTVLHIEVVTTM